MKSTVKAVKTERDREWERDREKKREERTGERGGKKEEKRNERGTKEGQLRDKGKPGNSGIKEAMKEGVLCLAEMHEYLLPVRAA